LLAGNQGSWLKCILKAKVINSLEFVFHFSHCFRRDRFYFLADRVCVDGCACVCGVCAAGSDKSFSVICACRHFDRRRHMRVAPRTQSAKAPIIFLWVSVDSLCCRSFLSAQLAAKFLINLRRFRWILFCWFFFGLACGWAKSAENIYFNFPPMSDRQRNMRKENCCCQSTLQICFRLKRGDRRGALTAVSGAGSWAGAKKYWQLSYVTCKSSRTRCSRAICLPLPLKQIGKCLSFWLHKFILDRNIFKTTPQEIRIKKFEKFQYYPKIEYPCYVSIVLFNF